MIRENAKQEIRESILDAAERLLARYGYSKMTMSDLAEEAGIGVGTTYLYFRSKGEVALAVVNRANQRVIEQLQAMACSSVSLPLRLREMLRMRILLRYEAVRIRSHRLEEFKNAVREQIALQQSRAQWFSAEVKMFAAVLQEGRDLAVLEVDDPLRTAETLLWAMDSLMPRNLKAADFEQPELIRDKTDRIADQLLRSLLPLDSKASTNA